MVCSVRIEELRMLLCFRCDSLYCYQSPLVYQDKTPVGPKVSSFYPICALFSLSNGFSVALWFVQH